IGVVVIAVGKPGSVVEEEIEAALVFEVGAIAFEIVGAELVDHQDDDELGMAVIGGGARGGNTEKRERANEDEGGESFELRHTFPVSQDWPSGARASRQSTSGTRGRPRWS